MTFQQLQYVVEISRCGSLNKAAQNLYVSHTAISAAVKALENELGITFFERSNRGVTFTPAGKTFVNHASSLLSQKSQLEGLFRSPEDFNEVPAFSVSAQRFMFIQEAFIRAFKQNSHTKYRLTYKEDNMDLVIRDVCERRADLGIISLTDFSERLIMYTLEMENLIFKELVSVMPRVFCRTGHPFTELETITETDILQYPYLFYEQGLGVAIEFAEEYQTILNRTPARTIIVNNRASVMEIIRTTDAFTIGSGLVSRELGSGITSVPLKTGSPIRIGYIVLQNHKISSLEEQFLSATLETIEDAMRYTIQ